METIRAKFTVVTPMYLGEQTDGAKEAKPQCAGGVRGPSFKGALRAAWRALNWGRLRDTLPDDSQALHALHREEGALFGSATKQDHGGQALFLLRVINDNIKTAKELHDWAGDEINYLLGQGLYDHKAGLLRDHITAGSLFTIELALKPAMAPAQKQQLLDALLWLGLTGNLGSRARKGFGSIALKELNHGNTPVTLPDSPESYKRILHGFLQTSRSQTIPPLTAVSRHTRIQISASNNHAVRLLKQHAREMALYRSYGRLNHQGERVVLGKPAELNFKPDHDWAYNVANRKPVKGVPQRAIFGLPHPYFLSSKQKVSIDSSTTRRSSPLFAHVHQFPDGTHALLHMIFKSMFLPPEASITVKGSGASLSVANVDSQIDWGVLERFLDRFKPCEVIHG